MKQRVPVSVVVPAYNSEDFIADAIRSVQAQTLPISEIIVIDDGSVDRTAEVAESLGAVVLRQTNRGCSGARNTGIRAAGNEWIAILDADDLWEPQKIEYQWAAVQRHPDVGVVSCAMTFFGDELAGNSSPAVDGALGSLRSEAGDDAGISYFPRVKAELPFSRMVDNPSSLLIRRDLLLSVGLYDESLRHNDDLECFLRLIARGHLAIVRRPLVRKRIHNTNISINNPSEVTTNYLKILDWLRDYPDKYPPGAARAYDEDFSRWLIGKGRTFLNEGRRREARDLFTRSLKKAYSNRAAFLWALSFVTPAFFKRLLTMKRKLVKKRIEATQSSN